MSGSNKKPLTDEPDVSGVRQLHKAVEAGLEPQCVQFSLELFDLIRDACRAMCLCASFISRTSSFNFRTSPSRNSGLS